MEKQETISIETKKLASGNCQVKFFVENGPKDQYGYLLMSEPKPVGIIIEEIKAKMEKRRVAERQIDPFFPVSPQSEDKNFYLFSA